MLKVIKKASRLAIVLLLALVVRQSAGAESVTLSGWVTQAWRHGCITIAVYGRGQMRISFAGVAILDSPETRKEVAGILPLRTPVRLKIFEIPVELRGRNKDKYIRTPQGEIYAWILLKDGTLVQELLVLQGIAIKGFVSDQSRSYAPSGDPFEQQYIDRLQAASARTK